MQLKPEDVLKLRPPQYELPKFEFETVTVDLQHIYSGDAQKDGMEAEKLVESFIAIQRQKAASKRKVIVAFYPNLHPNIKVCFLTFVLLDPDKVKVKQRVIPVIIPPAQGVNSNEPSSRTDRAGKVEPGTDGVKLD